MKIVTCLGGYVDRVRTEIYLFFIEFINQHNTNHDTEVQNKTRKYDTEIKPLM